ncbi:Rv1733c family protein [Rhodococcoides yunnanense]|uniref:Rv1733c family protein n=1 Tax=Rhodococcoides yunnanense TaxID=278209 RepID=UPI001114C84E|nr:hypothetical protein [Rhodococcus yunnanensis]
MDNSRIRRLWRLGPWNASPLMRRSNRTAFVAVATAVAVVLALVPVCALLGALTYTRIEAQSTMDAETHHRIEAVVVEIPAPHAAPAEYASVADYYATVEWKSDTGLQHDEQIKVPARTDTGQTVEIWVDDAGNRVDTPKTGLESAVLGVAAAIGTWVGSTLLLAIAVATMCGIGRRARMRQWDLEWRDLESRRGRHLGGPS